MVTEEAEEQVVDLLRELLLHEVAPLRDVGDLEVRHEVVHDAAAHGGLEPRELEAVVLLPHHHEHRHLELGVQPVRDLVYSSACPISFPWKQAKKKSNEHQSLFSLQSPPASEASAAAANLYGILSG